MPSNFLALLAAPLADPAMPMLALAALAGGLVRGFTGFGFAMVFMPLAGTVAPLQLAYALIFCIDAPVGLYLGARSASRAAWREVLPLLAGAALTLPIGLAMLVAFDQTLLRWLVAVVIAAAVAVLASGWRWKGRPGLPLSLGVGGLSGLANGLAALGGLPLAIFWLSAQAKSALQMRHDLMLYFGLSTVLSGALGWWKGLFSWEAAAMAVPLALIYALAVAVGSAGYRIASEVTFRRIAYAVIALASLASLPLWDGWLGR
ncbi:MAG: TSUP family transporter [Bosea sp.]|nr:TSUP family transporter [Bosea sp. (in: a-proteobacteria)]